MRILHIVKHCDRGHGNAHVAVDLACEQASLGHEVLFASRGGSFDSLLDAHGVQRYRIVQDARYRSLPFNITSFIGLCRRSKPNVIHAHMMASAIFGYVGGLVAGVPLVTTVHNSFDKHSFIMRLGKRVVAVSHAERALLLQRGYKKTKVVAILNGTIGSPRDAGSNSPDIMFPGPWIAMVCGLHRRKGVADVISAFAELEPRFPAWHLGIIGDGPDRAALEAQVDRQALRNVRFVGSVVSPLHLLANAAIFISASYAEPCGLSIIEARDAGCAIVGTKVGGTPEILQNGEAGQLLEPGDISTMVTILRTLMEEERTLQLWRARARQGAETFNTKRVARDYIAVYQQAIGA